MSFPQPTTNGMHNVEYRKVHEMNCAFGNLPSDLFLTKVDEGCHPKRIVKQLKNVFDEINEFMLARYYFESVRAYRLPSNLQAHLKKKGIELPNGIEDIEENENKIYSILLEDVRDALCDMKVFAYGALHMLCCSSYSFDCDSVLSVPTVAISANSSKCLLDRFFEVVVTDFDLNAAATVTSTFAQYLSNSAKYEELLPVNLVISTKFAILNFINMATQYQHMLGVCPIKDMTSVIDGVMTRFCENEIVLADTVLFWKNKGVTKVYMEGDFPKAYIKSSEDQPDAPKGKFLKSTTTRNPIFSPRF